MTMATATLYEPEVKPLPMAATRIGAPETLPRAATMIPLFHAAWLMACGIAVSQWMYLRPSLVLIAIGVIAALCVLAGFRAQRVLWLAMGALWLMLGYWCAVMEPHPAPEPGLAALSDGLLREVDGVVIDAGPVRVQHLETTEGVDSEWAEPRGVAPEPAPAQTIDVKLASLEVVDDTTDQQRPAGGVVRLTVHWPADAVDPSAVKPIECGHLLRVPARLLPPEVYHDAGVWSRRDYLLDEGVTSTATVKAEAVMDDGRAAGLPTPCVLSSLRHATAQRLLQLPERMTMLPQPLRLSEADAAMLAAMITGDRAFLTKPLRVGFERTGSFHMLVVSGFHLAIVAGFLFYFARRIRLPRVVATLATIAATGGYALFTGFAIPVQRSFWIVALYLIGRLFFRDRSPLNTIGFAALCLLTVSPRSLFDSSFEMTLLAVVAIAGVATPLLQRTIHPYLMAIVDLRSRWMEPKLAPNPGQFRMLARMFARALGEAFGEFWGWRAFPWGVRLALRCAELAVVSLVVELAMTLPMAIYFHRITLFALPVNALLLPFLVCLMPVAMVLLALLAVWPAAAVVPAVVVAVLMHLAVGLVRLFGAMSLAEIRISGPVLWQMLAFCALLGSAIALARSLTARTLQATRFYDSKPRRWWLSSATWAVAALLLAAIVSVLPRPVQHPRDALLVQAIDVGQGDSILLIAPDGTSMLVDAGGFGGSPHMAAPDFDIGEEIVSAALWSRGIRRLDVVALTHAHSDHMGGMPAVLRNFRPRELWVGDNPHTSEYDALLAVAAKQHITVRELRRGDMMKLGAARVEVLAPTRDYQPGNAPTNNDSLVMRAAFDNQSVLLEGDAEGPVEDQLATLPNVASTLLKVGHHGSLTSTTPGFLTAVHPQWAVISCGLHNRFGHPREEILQRLENAKVRTLHTDTSGAACFELAPNQLRPDPQCEH